MHSTRTWISSPFGPFYRASWCADCVPCRNNTVMLKWTYSLPYTLNSFRHTVKIRRGYYSGWNIWFMRSRCREYEGDFSRGNVERRDLRRVREKKATPSPRKSGIYYCNIEDLDKENELMIKWCGATFYQMARTKETRVRHPPFISVFQPHFRFISLIYVLRILIMPYSLFF